MKELTKLSSKAIGYCNLSGFPLGNIKIAIKEKRIHLFRLTTKDEMIKYNVDFNYPYIILDSMNRLIW